MPIELSRVVISPGTVTMRELGEAYRHLAMAGRKTTSAIADYVRANKLYPPLTGKVKFPCFDASGWNFVDMEGPLVIDDREELTTKKVSLLDMKVTHEWDGKTSDALMQREIQRRKVHQKRIEAVRQLEMRLTPNLGTW